MNRLTSREKLLVTILGGLIFLTLIYFLLTPQVIKYQELCHEIEQTTKKSEQLININEELQAEQSNLLAMQYQLQELQSQFNKELRDGSLYLKLDEGARANNVTIKEVVPQKVIDSDAYLLLPITISFCGDYRNILAYMQWLENINDWANLSEIKQFVIEPDKEFPNGGVVNSTLTLSLYSNVTPEGRMQIEALANWPAGRSNGFIPTMEYHYLHNNQQNGGQ